MTSIPVLKYDQRKIKTIQKPSITLLNSFSIFFIIVSLASFPETISNLYEGVSKIIFDSYAGLEMYQTSIEAGMDAGDGSITNLFAILTNSFSNLGILLFFYYQTIHKRNRFISIGLAISCIILVFEYISLGQRGGVFLRLSTIVITYFALRNFYSKKINRKIIVIGVIVVISISIPLIALTSSRFGESEGGSIGSLTYYAGQGNLYFNNYGLDDGGIRYGDRTFPLFKKMVGFTNVPDNFWERRAKYPNLKINDEVFSTFVGDFTIDFGPIIAALIFIISTFLILKSTKVRNGKLLFHQLILIHFVMCVCIQGGMGLFSFSDVGGNLRLIVVFLAYVFFRIDYEINTFRNKNY